MKYMLLIYQTPDSWSGMSEAEQAATMGEYFAFGQTIVESGEMVTGDALQGIETATSVRVESGRTIVTDGPFAETKEVLGGFYLVDADSVERAHELAAMIPAARNGTIEVRPVLEFAENDAG